MQRITLLLKSDCVSDPDHKGKTKMIKKNIITRISLHVTDIKRPVEIYNLKGEVLKKECRIILEDGNDLIVKHSFDEVTKMISPIIVKGFRK